ncbi:MAG: two-component system, OmpR family, sensor histidine kinase PrrB, partial [Solirubrobacteraceae bacterium]|nr:two-component system, OmpR family, sensor histidine kinase PrrB [Solirubrobacteraceae bacterium]
RGETIDPDGRTVALDAAATASDRMNRLVDGLQGLARGEAGLAGQTEVDLGEVAEGAVLAARARHPALTIDLDAPASGPMLRGDSDGLARVLDNLVENAAVHGRTGGHVRVTVTPDTVTVEDDGPGIPPGDRARVLERFARGADTPAPGSGLGLAIVAAEAARHDGTLTLDDSPLGGLRATVKLSQKG